MIGMSAPQQRDTAINGSVPLTNFDQHEDNNVMPQPDEDRSSITTARTRIAATVLAMMLCFALVGLDQNIVATAVPAITQYFGSITQIGWYTSIYRLTASSFQLFFGKLYSLFPARRILLVSLVIFGCGNLVCALAARSEILIVGRALTGVATAGLISGAFALVTHTFPLHQRPIYAGIGGGTEAIAAVCAPLVGGVLTDRLSWRWCFYVQLPFTALALAVVTVAARLPDPSLKLLKTKLHDLDCLGAGAFVVAMTCLLLAVQWGGGEYSWSSWQVIVPFVISILLLLVFGLTLHRRRDRAILPPRILLQRNIVFGCIFSCCNNGALAIIEYYMPIYFQIVRGTTATMSGVMLLPIAVGLIVTVLLSGFVTSTIGYYSPTMILTSIMTPVAAGLLSTLSQYSKIWKVILFQGLLGFGTGIGFQGPQVAVQTVLSKQDAPIGIAIIQFAQGIGPAIFTAAAQSLFLARLAHSADKPDILGPGAFPATNTNSDNRLVDEDMVRSYDRSLTEVFYLPTALYCLSLVGALGMEKRSVKKRPS